VLNTFFTDQIVYQIRQLQYQWMCLPKGNFSKYIVNWKEDIGRTLTSVIVESAFISWIDEYSQQRIWLQFPNGWSGLIIWYLHIRHFCYANLWLSICGQYNSLSEDELFFGLLPFNTWLRNAIRYIVKQIQIFRLARYNLWRVDTHWYIWLHWIKSFSQIIISVDMSVTVSCLCLCFIGYNCTCNIEREIHHWTEIKSIWLHSNKTWKKSQY
jgi:hypothetical protein